jgi:hypothetical protein
MRLLFLSIFLIVNLLGAKDCKAQGPGTFQWTNGAPNNNPGLSGAKFAVDKNTYRWYEWVSGTSWVQSGDRIQQISGCAAPAYTPTIHNAYFVVNGCTEPEFYYWNGTAWKLLNGGGATYTAGSGIAISGTNVISNTSPNVNQTLSLSGQNLSLSNGGGTVSVPNIYTSNGAITSNRIITANDKLLEIRAFSPSLGQYPAFRIQSSEIAFAYEYDNGVVSKRSDVVAGEDFIRFTRRNANNEQYLLEGTDNGWTFSQQGAPEFNGVKYDAFYPQIEFNEQSIPDVQTVDNLKQKLKKYRIDRRGDIENLETGYVIFCTDCEADDSSIGVMQVWNGTTWKNAW